MARYVKFFGLGGGVDGFITGSCNTVQATSYLQANGPQANINVAIIPKGTGAIVAACPDGTAAGGNARGQYAVDLQMARSNPTEVASGYYSFIGSGFRNDVSGSYSFIGSGYRNDNAGSYAFIGSGNNNSLTGSYQTIVGGLNNSITSPFSTSSFIGGGDTNSITAGANQTRCVIAGGQSNTVSSSHSTISGGQSNTASTGTHATVVGGQGNVSSGQWSVSGGQNATASGNRAIAFGESAQATGGNSVAIGGQASVAQASFSVAIGGIGNNALSSYSLAQGYVTQTNLQGQVAFSGTAFTFSSERGYCQQSLLTANRQATLNSAATTVLSLDGTGTTNLIIPYGNNRAWNVKVETIAVVTSITGTATGVSVGDSLMQDDTILFTKVGGTSSVVGVNNTNLIASTSMGTAGMSFTAGASQELALTFTAPTFAGGGSVTCRVVSKVSLVEVAW